MFSIDALRIIPIGIAALTSLGGCGGGEDGGPTEDGGRSAESLALRPTGQPSFDSSEHPDLAELSAVAAGLFLPDSGLALVQRSEIHLIDLLSGTTRVVGREGEGPREFRHIGRAVRVADGILVSDVPRRRVSLISYDGEFLRSRSVVDAEFGDYFGAYPVGVHPDGRIVFRDGIAQMGRDYDGQTWSPAMYVIVRDDGALEIVAEATGDEVYFGSDIRPTKPRPKTTSSSPRRPGEPLPCWTGAVERLGTSPCRPACGCPTPGRWGAGCF